MEETLFNSLNVNRNEWRLFVEGRALTVGLLLKLLQYKYQRQKSVLVNTRIIHLDENASFSDLVKTLDDKPLPEFVAYELTLVVVHYATSLLATLVVRRHALPLIVFTVDGGEQAIEEEGSVRYFINNRFKLNMDNGYFVFDFLEHLFHADPDPNARRTFLYPTNAPADTKVLAQNIINELTDFTRVKENLVRLYKQINQRLRELHGTATQREEEQLRMAVEYDKQEFYRWIDCALLDCASFPEKNQESVCFSPISVILATKEEEEAEAESITSRKSDALLKEMVGLLQFLVRVIQTSDTTHASGVALVVNEQPLNVESIKKRIQRLRYVLVARIDAANTPQITLSMSKELGFTQQEFNLLIEQSFLPYNILVSYLRDQLHPEALLLGPNEAGEAEKVDIPSIQAAARLIFWVLERPAHNETEDPYSALMLLQSPQILGLWQRCVYAPTNAIADVEEIMAIADELLDKTRIVAYRRQFVSHYDRSTSKYSFTSWYVLFIVKTINERLLVGHESLDHDWIDEVEEIIRNTSRRMIDEAIETVTYKIRALILSLVIRVPQKCVIEIIDIRDEEGEKFTPVTLQSNVSDLAKLLMKSQYIDDNPIIDTIAMMEKVESCYIFDPTYWGNMMIHGFDKSLRKNKIFQKAATDLSLVLIPLNQDLPGKPRHWSLAIIDLNNNNVIYYSSIDKDPYFESTFKPKITEYLAVQTPGILYRIVSEKGRTQTGCLDCAIFMLNMISSVCTNSNITYDRLTIGNAIRERLIELTKGLNNNWHRYAEDFYSYYLNLPDEWREIRDDRAQLNKYRNNYLGLLGVILEQTQLFTNESILKIQAKLKSIDRTISVNNIETLFVDTLVLLNEPIKRKREEEQEEEEAKQPAGKIRKCLTYDKGTLELIQQLLTHLYMLKRLQKTSITLEEFDKKYGTYIHDKLLAPLVPNLFVRESFLRDLIAVLFSSVSQDIEVMNTRLLDVIEDYVECTEAQRQVMKCFYCGTLTLCTDLTSNRAYCSKECHK